MDRGGGTIEEERDNQGGMEARGRKDILIPDVPYLILLHIYVTVCNLVWSKGERGAERSKIEREEATVTSLAGFYSIFCYSCCYSWLCRELCVIASRWVSEVIKCTFKVWLGKKKRNQDSHNPTLSFCPFLLCLFLFFAFLDLPHMRIYTH